MIRALPLLLILAGPLQAETARVLSGEHETFTRLVIELPQGSDWILGRTTDGYAFGTSDGPLDFDLSTVWQRIPRSRLASLEVDPATGALSLGLACDCHVFPFEYRAGIVVLDIKAGPAPAGSAFETPFRPAPALVSPMPAPAGGYNWLADLQPGTSSPEGRLPLPLNVGTVSLKPLRDELLEQIAKGAADGVVDMERPGKPPKPQEVDHPDLPWSNIRIGEEPGLSVTNAGALIEEEAVNPDCAPAELLDIAAWGDGRLPQDLLAESRVGLYGEFDVADEDAVLRSVRQQLYLGFGAEALQTVDLLGPSSDAKGAALYRSMARLVDGEADPQTPFSPMLDCDGPAALWAALAHDRLPAGPGVNRDAILQAYLSLPPHLRWHLGPGLADKFLARDDADAARMIRDAMERSPDVDPRSVALLDAKAELHEGDADAAMTHAEAALALDGDDAESLIAVVESHFRKLEPLRPEIAEALLGLRRETDSTQIGPEVDRSVVLALALSGQIGPAFAQPGAATALSDLWRVASVRATDDQFLLHAVLAPDTPAPQVEADVRQTVADRLLALGFPDAALAWLGPLSPEATPQMRLTAASAELESGDARAAVTALVGLEGPEADALRGKALLRLGDLPAAQDALAAAGDAEAALRASLWQENWDSLDPAAPESWQRAAEVLGPAPSDGATGLLGRGGKAAEASLTSREAIEALLASVPSPAVE